ncbi:MAG TPA: NAD(P)/FAD-dependent oxidoreductase [Vicinamibacterales bacterium]
MSRGRTIIIGAGHNGLTAAFYLAKAGRRPLVLERGSVVGGGAVTAEIAPGFRCPTLSHEERLHRRIVVDMNLPAFGVEWIPESVDTCALDPAGPALVLFHDAARTASALRQRSQGDAARWADFSLAAKRTAQVLRRVLDEAPPEVAHPGLGDLWRLLNVYLETRGLERADAHRLMRWLPMPIADMVEEWFEDDVLRATVAARGLLGTAHGPRAAGSTLVWLTREAHEMSARPVPARVRGGPGALTQAMARAAQSVGAEIRLGQRVERIVVSGGRVSGVVVEGREIAADCVVSGADPKTTFLTLMDAADLPQDFAAQIGHYRSAGTLAKLNIALSGLPGVLGVSDATHLSGRVHIGPSIEALEDAGSPLKYGAWSRSPWLEVRVPSLVDPTLAPPNAHVASVYVHGAPRHLKDSSWAVERAGLLGVCMRTLEDYAPGFASLVVKAQLLTPEDIEREHGAWGGHGFHGDLALDQWFVMRPTYGYARHATPVRGLFLCGAGTHPGGFLVGTSGRLAAEEALRRS